MFNILSDTFAIATRTDRPGTVGKRRGRHTDKRRQRREAERALEQIKIRRFLG